MLEGASQLESRFLALEILILKEGNMQTRENHGGYEGNGEPTIWKYLYLLLQSGGEEPAHRLLGRAKSPGRWPLDRKSVV